MPLYSLNIFRAIAIVMVVLSHMSEIGALSLDTVHELTLWNLFAGPPTMFVFISGFLFHHVFLARFAFASFFTKKLKNLVIPYVILTCVAVAVGCEEITRAPVGNWIDQVWLGGYLLATGDAAISYWYMPVIVVLFAMAPLHVQFTKLGMRWQMAIVGVMLAIALFIHRPPGGIGLVQNLLFFTPTYLLGIFCSQHRTHVYAWLAGRELPLLAAVLLLAWLQAVLGHSGNYFKPMLEFGGLDMMLLQKLCLSLLLLSFLHRFETWRSKTVDIVAETSFAVFFLHPIPIALLRDHPLAAPYLVEESWLLYFVASALILALCAATALWARRVFGTRSRMLTGY